MLDEKNNMKKIFFITKLVLLPIVEAGILILLAKYIGALMLFCLVTLSTLVGFSILKIRWKRVHGIFDKAFDKAIDKENPLELTDSQAEFYLFWCSFILFLTPGFITDGYGYYCMFPSARQKLSITINKFLKKNKHLTSRST